MAENNVLKIDVGEVIRTRAPRLARLLPGCIVRRLERLICQKELNRLLEENAGKTNGAFCKGVLESLDITVTMAHQERLPARNHRRVVFVCNHPLGGLDGIALINLIESYFGGQVWFIVNDLLMAVKPLEGVFLPINKFGKQSRATYRAIDDAFAGNDPIIIFPAGLCSRLNTVDSNGTRREVISDLEWHKMFVNKCVAYKRDIVPLFFSGQNSMNFYKKARLRKRLGIKFNLEQVMLPREMIQSRGKTYTVVVGHMHPYTEFEGGHNADKHAAELKAEVYALAKQAHP